MADGTDSKDTRPLLVITNGDEAGDGLAPEPAAAPVPRHKIPLGQQFTLAEWMSHKQALPKVLEGWRPD